jgi:phage tail protein X
MGESYSAINAMTQEARATAQKSQTEVQKLSGSMLNKNQQVAENLARINSVGAEIQKDINQIIISMQFQDITQQKLRRLKAPVLSEVLKAVHSLADETRFLNQRLNANLVDVSGIDASTPFRVVKNGAITTVDTEEQEAPRVGGKQPGESDGKVELF